MYLCYAFFPDQIRGNSAHVDLPPFPRLKHLSLHSNDLSYPAFSTIFFASPRLNTFRLYLEQRMWIKDFDQQDFINRYV